MNYMIYRLFLLFTVLGSLSYAKEIINESQFDTIATFSEEEWIYPDDPYVANLDSAWRKLFLIERSFSNVFDTTQYELPLDSVPGLDTNKIKESMRMLDLHTPMSIEYNKYSARMIKFYLTKRREMLSRVLGLSVLYFPIFESELSKEQLPVELKHLAVVESALLNVVKSRAGAVGLWQFMYNTAVYLGMNIDSYIDERRDPFVSTKFAVKYLKYLHGLYGDWYMALAAYNAGPGNVNKAIRRSGGKKTFWEIYKYLPRETRFYVPAFIAVNYVMNNTKEHNIRPVHPKYQYHEIDTVHVNEPVSFDQISEVLCVDIEELRFLNPQYKLDFIPVDKSVKRNYALVLPFPNVGEFVINEQVIYNHKPFELIDSLKIDSVSIERELTHVVRSGQNIGSIANKYDVTVNEVKLWNNLKGSVIYPKQKLLIKKKEKQILPKQYNSQQDFIYYKVKKGDTLSEIASQHKGVSVRSIGKLNGLSKRVVLYPGTNLKLKRIKRK